MMAEKLSRAKVLVEVECQEGGRTDLAGDAGAVGRWAASTEGGVPQVKLDLKGACLTTLQHECIACNAMPNLA